MANPQEWRHLDVLKLIHARNNEIAKNLFENNKNQIAERVRMLKAARTPNHQLVTCLDATHAPVAEWARAVNPCHARNSVFWLKMVEKSVSFESFLELIPKIIQKFPNNKRLFGRCARKTKELARDQTESAENAQLARHLVLLLLERKSLPAARDLRLCLEHVAPSRAQNDFYLVVDRAWPFDEHVLGQRRPEARDPEARGRRRKDLLDDLLFADLLRALGGALDPLLPSGARFSASPVFPTSGSEFPGFPFPNRREKNILFLTQEAVDAALWPQHAPQLVVAHVEKRAVASGGHFRRNCE